MCVCLYMYVYASSCMCIRVFVYTCVFSGVPLEFAFWGCPLNFRIFSDLNSVQKWFGARG